MCPSTAFCPLLTWALRDPNCKLLQFPSHILEIVRYVIAIAPASHHLIQCHPNIPPRSQGFSVAGYFFTGEAGFLVTTVGLFRGVTGLLCISEGPSDFIVTCSNKMTGVAAQKKAFLIAAYCTLLSLSASFCRVDEGKSSITLYVGLFLWSTLSRSLKNFELCPSSWEYC